MKTNNYKWLFSQLAVVALMLPAAIGLTSCSEDIDESNLYTATGQTIEDYLASEPEFSDFNYILKRAGLDKVLSAYGKYTCFAPVNEAVQIYVDSLWNDTTRTDHNGMTVELWRDFPTRSAWILPSSTWLTSANTGLWTWDPVPPSPPCSAVSSPPA